MSTPDSSFTAKVGVSMAKIVIAALGAITVMVGAVTWLNTVDSTAKSALKISLDNNTKIEAIQSQMSAQANQLTEIRVDLKYLVQQTAEIKNRQIGSK